ncbi:MAG: hypothetical protein ACLQRM_07055 [Acidimicrobiales bacterium]
MRRKVPAWNIPRARGKRRRSQRAETIVGPSVVCPELVSGMATLIPVVGETVRPSPVASDPAGPGPTVLGGQQGWSLLFSTSEQVTYRHDEDLGVQALVGIHTGLRLDPRDRGV